MLRDYTAFLQSYIMPLITLDIVQVLGANVAAVVVVLDDAPPTAVPLVDLATGFLTLPTTITYTRPSGALWKIPLELPEDRVLTLALAMRQVRFLIS